MERWMEEGMDGEIKGEMGKWVESGEKQGGRYRRKMEGYMERR